MILPQFDFRQLKRRVAIEQVLAGKNLLTPMRRRGSHLVGPCPIHHGDNPNAFTVHLEKNIWHCFTGCDAGGDVIELARRLCRGSYKAAAVYLTDLVETPLPMPAQSVPARKTRPFRPFTRLLSLDPKAALLKRKGIAQVTARRFQVGAYYGPGMLAGCLAVRLSDPQGKPLGYAGRRLDAEQARARGKWKFPSGLPRNTLLYGYHQTARLRRRGVVLVECPWGVLRLAQLGIPAVALLGTHFSPAQHELLLDLPIVVVLMDGDQAGRNAAEVIQRRLKCTAVVDLPDGLDPDDLSDQELATVQEHLLL